MVQFLPKGFEDLPSESLSHQRNIIQYPSVRSAIGMDLTEAFKRDLHERHVTKKLNAVISAFGATGSGKSKNMLGMCEKWIAPWLGIKFSAKDNVVFDAFEQLDMVENMKTPNILFCDEDPRASSGSGVKRVQEERINLENIAMRKARLTAIFISPRLEEHQHHFILEPWAKNYKTFETLYVWRDALDMFHPVLGYVILPPPSEKLWAEYTKIANENVKKYLDRSGANMAEHLEKQSLILAKDVRFNQAIINKTASTYNDRLFVASKVIPRIFTYPRDQQKLIITGAIYHIKEVSKREVPIGRNGGG